MKTPFLAKAFALFGSLSLLVMVIMSHLFPARVLQSTVLWKKLAVEASFSILERSSCKSEKVYGKQCAKNCVSSSMLIVCTKVSV